MSSSILETLQIRKPASLPVSSSSSDEPGLLRRRLSSLSLSLSRNQPSTTDANFPRSKPVSSMGDHQGGSSSVKEWWEWSWSLILLKKLPVFITDLELNKNDQPKSSFAGSTNLLTNVFSKIRRLLRPSSSDSLPLSCKYGQR